MPFWSVICVFVAVLTFMYICKTVHVFTSDRSDDKLQETLRLQHSSFPVVAYFEVQHFTCRTADCHIFKVFPMNTLLTAQTSSIRMKTHGCLANHQNVPRTAYLWPWWQMSDGKQGSSKLRVHENTNTALVWSIQ